MRGRDAQSASVSHGQKGTHWLSRRREFYSSKLLIHYVRRFGLASYTHGAYVCRRGTGLLNVRERQMRFWLRTGIIAAVVRARIDTTVVPIAYPDEFWGQPPGEYGEALSGPK
jgi:hypothetical protein